MIASLISLLIFNALAEEPTLQPVVQPPSIENKSASEPVSPVAHLLNLRDPFRRPATVAETDPVRSDLERHPLSSYKLIGIVTGLPRLKAILMTPEGRTHFVSENIKIGMRGGIIKKITPDRILIREKIRNIVGQDESVDTELRLPTENKMRSSTQSQETPFQVPGMPEGIGIVPSQ